MILNEHNRQEHAAVGCVFLRGAKKTPGREFCKEKEKHYEVRQGYVHHIDHSSGHYDPRKRRCQNVRQHALASRSRKYLLEA